MMGRQVGEAQLFYIFSIERHVPADHLLRRVDAFLDLSFIRASLADELVLGLALLRFAKKLNGDGKRYYHVR
jgi:hypothetical protein